MTTEGTVDKNLITKTKICMSLFHHTLEEHRQLLEAKGYTEKNLDAPDRDGWYMRQFKANFSLCSNQAHRYDEVTDFDLKMIGFFNDNKDVVHFTFNYEYDPQTLELKIKTLTADLAGNKLPYHLTKNEDLPASMVVYKELALARKKATLKKTPDTQINLIIEEQALFLDLFGYYKTLLSNPPNLIVDELRQRLGEIAKKPAHGIEEIKIERMLHLSEYDKMSCSFQYKYEPTLMLLNLDSIIAKTKEVEKSFQIKKEVPLLTIQTIYDDLTKSNRLSNAFQINQHQPRNGKSIRL